MPRSGQRHAARTAMIAGVAAAVILVAVSGYGHTAETAQSTRPLDLVSDRPDPNHVPLNPRWGYQTTIGSFNSYQIADPRDLCNPIFSFRSYDVSPDCTSQPTLYDGPTSLHSVACSFWRTGPAPGHSNWRPTTYTGRIYWGGHSNPVYDDDDYSFDLATPNARGVFTGDGAQVHLEFSSDETIDNFLTKWWSDFHQAVDESDNAAESLVANHQAIATGLTGVDWVHQPGAESHPVWALAIQGGYGRTPTGEILDETGNWSFFVRNWGDEGYCSHRQYFLDLHSAPYTFHIPWEVRLSDGRPATNVTIDPTEQEIWAHHIPGATPPVFRVIHCPRPCVRSEESPQDGVYVSFKMPKPELNVDPFYEGTIRLHWTFPPCSSKCQPPTNPPPTEPKCNKVPPPPGCDVEHFLQAVLAPLFSKREKAALAKRLTRPPLVGNAVRLRAIRTERVSSPPRQPLQPPTTHASTDIKDQRYYKLQRALLCRALRKSSALKKSAHRTQEFVHRFCA